MWWTTFRITDGALTKQFDLLDALLLSVGWLVAGVMIGLGAPVWKIMVTTFMVAVVYLFLFLIISYIRQICFGRITNTDPFYGGSE